MDNKKLINEENRYNSQKPPPLSPQKTTPKKATAEPPKTERKSKPKAPKDSLDQLEERSDVAPVSPRESARQTPAAQKSFRVRSKAKSMKSLTSVRITKIKGMPIAKMSEEEKE